LSVERAQFDADQGVYRDDLATPAAEEFELSLRLRDRGIPILLATRIEAVHDQATRLADICRQAYKHSMGCAEAAVKYPRTVELQGLGEVIRANRPLAWADPAGWEFGKVVKALLSAGPARRALARVIAAVERVTPSRRLLWPLYRAALSAHMMKGVRDGLAAYSGQRAGVLGRV
jgi:hypothetical protein